MSATDPMTPTMRIRLPRESVSTLLPPVRRHVQSTMKRVAPISEEERCGSA